MRNAVVLTGDVHSHWAAEVHERVGDPLSDVVATELVTTSITSGGDGSDTRRGRRGHPPRQSTRPVLQQPPRLCPHQDHRRRTARRLSHRAVRVASRRAGADRRLVRRHRPHANPQPTLKTPELRSTRENASDRRVECSSGEGTRCGPELRACRGRCGSGFRTYTGSTCSRTCCCGRGRIGEDGSGPWRSPSLGGSYASARISRRPRNRGTRPQPAGTVFQQEKCECGPAGMPFRRKLRRRPRPGRRSSTPAAARHL